MTERNARWSRRATGVVAVSVLAVGAVALTPAGAASSRSSAKNTAHSTKLVGGHRAANLARQATPRGAQKAASGPGLGAPIATGLNGPFGLGSGVAGRVLVAVTGIGTDPPGPGQVVEARRGGQNVVATGASFLTDADSRGGNDLSYLVGAPTNTLVQRAANGRTSTVDIGAFEAANNPDQGSTYGPLTQLNVSQACQATIPPDLAQVLAQYQGVVDSDAFRMLQLPGGSTLVADAAGNDVLRVAANGAISVVAVLPPNPTHLDKAFVAQATDDAGDTFPPCFIDAVPASGIDIAFEPVPTGLALGPDGNLYVGELPGGELPGSGRVVRVNMNTGAVEPFAGGLSDVTDIAFGKNGALYTTELFAPAPGSDPSSPDFVPGTLAKFPTSKVNGKLVAGNPSFLAAPLPNGLTVDQQGTLYASILSLTPAGMVVPVNF